jgi:hypothetical protein
MTKGSNGRNGRSSGIASLDHRSATCSKKVYMITDKCTTSTSQMYNTTPGKISETEVTQPTFRAPTPMSRYWICYAGDNNAEQDVAVEVTPLRDGSGNNRCTCRGKSTLKNIFLISRSKFL